MNKIVMCFVCVLFLMPSMTATATELVYTPINPSFGGSPLNGQWLLASAQAQNKLTEPKPERTLLEDFQKSLTRQVIHRLSAEIVNSVFGEDSIFDESSGTSLSIGEFGINVTTDDNGLIIEVLDTGSGNTTTVEIPFP